MEPTPTLSATPSPEIHDAFSMVIEAERFSIMVDNALSASDQASSQPGAQSVDEDLLRIDLALREGARNLLQLRDALCMDGHAVEDSCVAISLPEWVMTAPDPANVSLDEYRKRIDWLGAASGKLAYIGCEAGKAASENEYLCAIE